MAALACRPGSVLEVQLSGVRGSPAWQEVARLAEEQRVRVSLGAPTSEGRRRPRHGETEEAGRTSMAVAVVREKEETPLDVLFARETIASNPHGLWLALDQLQDPHNVGAIFRTAAFFGVRGIVLTRDRSAPLTATVYDVASGGIEHVPWSQPANLSRTLEVAKEAGLWILGTSEHAEKDLREVPRDRPWLLVLGNEERGLRSLSLKTCDEVCRLTPRGAVASLNVSVAAGVLMAALTVEPAT